MIEIISENNADPSHTEVLIKRNKGDELSDVARYQHDRHCLAILLYWENAHYRRQMGLYDDDEYSMAADLQAELLPLGIIPNCAS